MSATDLIQRMRTDAHHPGVAPATALMAATELEELYELLEGLEALVQPILDRTEGQIGTHSDKCYEYHVACLAAVVSHRVSIRNSSSERES